MRSASASTFWRCSSAAAVSSRSMRSYVGFSGMVKGASGAADDYSEGRPGADRPGENLQPRRPHARMDLLHRIRWGNVARAGALVLAVALVALWPRLRGGGAPELPAPVSAAAAPVTAPAFERASTEGERTGPVRPKGRRRVERQRAAERRRAAQRRRRVKRQAAAQRRRAL